MKSNPTLCNAQSVVAAMARATRRTSKVNTTAQLNSASEVTPHYLIPALRTFAQQQQQSPKNTALNRASSVSTSFIPFFEAAHAAATASLEHLEDLAKERTEKRGIRTHQEQENSKMQTEKTTSRFNVEVESAQDRYTLHSDLFSDQPPAWTKQAEQARKELTAAVRAYNPTVHAPLIERTAARLAIADTLLLAKQLVRYLHEAAAAEQGTDASIPMDGFAENEEQSIPTAKAVQLLRRAIDVCRVRYADSGQSTRLLHRSPMLPVASSSAKAPWAFTTAARESAGIGLRFHHTAASLTLQGQRRRRPQPRCFVRHVSDIQVSEVLPSGAVVVFTHPTHPSEVDDRAAVSQVQVKPNPKGPNKRTRKALPSFRESLESCLAASPAEVHVHGVLYRCGIAMAAAVADLIDATDGLIRREDVYVCSTIPEDDDYVVVQLCSICITIPTALRGQGHMEEAIQHCLHVARTLTHVNVASDARAGGESGPNVGLQLLYCRPHSCAAPHNFANDNGSCSKSSQLQYALLLRGFDQRGGPADQLDRAALQCSEAIPNFFAPSHFGPPNMPFFRTYHVTAALDRGRYAEAAAMLLCITCGAEATAPASATIFSLREPWLEQALHLLCRGEEREGAWLAWWRQQVPNAVQTRLRSAKAELVWNVLASCRLQELASATNGRADALLAAPPEPGDFVRCYLDVSAPGKEKGGDERSDDDLELSGTFATSQESRVIPVYSQAEAARYTVHHTVLPVVWDAANPATGCDGVAKVEVQLGFAARPLHRHSSPFHHKQQQQLTSPLFRPLFISATGYPRATRPWTRSFQEPSSPVAFETSPNAFSLATDWALASGGRLERDYAAKSRGPRAQVWPLSKRGRALSERLPVGLLAVASANGSSLLSSETGLSYRHASRCLAIHCTLPIDVSLSNYLCEFTRVEDLRTSS